VWERSDGHGKRVCGGKEAYVGKGEGRRREREEEPVIVFSHVFSYHNN
jgi:hypothetical protein